MSETVASVLRQDYPEVRHDLLTAGTARVAAERMLADPGNDHVLWLGAGDLLAPGALIALALEAFLTGAAAVAGLRVLFDDAVRALDIPTRMGAPDGVVFAGGAILWRRDALASTQGGADGSFDAASAWSAIPAQQRSCIGRPVLLHRLTVPAASPAAGLSIVSLTGTGTQGGAGVAQRRLGAALDLAGHRITDIALSRHPEAAEWTDRFPR
ncbi:MAG: glycosyl transferase family 1, partial [Parafilimonas terrae]|nr:glycosyl transferase family 1 [Parafilimonas terrae]